MDLPARGAAELTHETIVGHRVFPDLKSQTEGLASSRSCVARSCTEWERARGFRKRLD